MTEFYLLALLSIASGVLLTIKGRYSQDLSVLGTSLSRFYLAFVAILVGLGYAGMFDLFWAVSATLVGDIVNYTMYMYGRKRYLNRLKSVSDKLYGVMETTSIPLFTIHLDGYIEYCNPAMMKEFSPSICGRNLYAMFNIDRDTLLKELEVDFIHNNKKYHIKGFRTKNGHDTITGSIQ